MYWALSHENQYTGLILIYLWYFKVDANEEKDVLVSNEYFVNTEKALVMVQSATWLKEGSNYTLVVRYDGKLKEALQGFYKSSYKNKAGETRWEKICFWFVE